MQRRFVSDVSHELRTPLTTVRMAGDVLHDARGRFDPSTARAAELLQNELDRFELLLADLLEISRFDAGAAVLDLEDVSIVDLARRVVESTRPLAERRGHPGAWSARRRPPAWPRSDVRRVERIVRNLVTNAIDYADSVDVVVLVASERARPPRSPSATTASGSSRARPRWCSTASGGPTRRGPAPAAAPAWGCRSRWRTPTCTAAGCRPGASPGDGAQFRLTLPRLAGDALSGAPCPWCPPTRPRRTPPRCRGPRRPDQRRPRRPAAGGHPVTLGRSGVRRGRRAAVAAASWGWHRGQRVRQPARQRLRPVGRRSTAPATGRRWSTTPPAGPERGSAPVPAGRQLPDRDDRDAR